MNSSHDPFGYERLPGWSQLKTIEVPAKAVSGLGKWQAIVGGVGVCFGVLFAAQLMLAIASHDLKEYRARSIDTASGASGMGAMAIGFVVWRKLKNG